LLRLLLARDRMEQHDRARPTPVEQSMLGLVSAELRRQYQRAVIALRELVQLERDVAGDEHVVAVDTEQHLARGALDEVGRERARPRSRSTGAVVGLPLLEVRARPRIVGTEAGERLDEPLRLDLVELGRLVADLTDRRLVDLARAAT